jgi:hypothetical protein
MRTKGKGLIITNSLEKGSILKNETVSHWADVVEELSSMRLGTPALNINEEYDLLNDSVPIAERWSGWTCPLWDWVGREDSLCLLSSRVLSGEWARLSGFPSNNKRGM